MGGVGPSATPASLTGVSVIIPVLAAFSPYFIGARSLPGALGGLPDWVQSLAWGAIVGLTAYLLYRFFAAREPMLIQKSVLLGLIVAEVLVVHRITAFPSWAMTTLFLFIFFNGVGA